VSAEAAFPRYKIVVHDMIASPLSIHTQDDLGPDAGDRSKVERGLSAAVTQRPSDVQNAVTRYI
jgi:hypothetical protein